MAPPAMHPRSKRTSALFGFTLLASFLVVGLPHVMPCPAPRIAYADGQLNPDGTMRRRRRRRKSTEDDSLTKTPEGSSNSVTALSFTRHPIIETKTEEVSGSFDVKGKRECPIPKPGGIVGELLRGRSSDERTITRAEGSRPP